MDEVVNRMTRAGARTLAALPAAALAALLAGPAGAQALQDPTRPPAASLAGTPAAPPAAIPQLQSVLVGRAAGGRRVAVIDGETVRLGDTFHGARVARVGETEVELVRGRERQVLRLYAPDAQLAPVPVAPAADAGAAVARR